MGIVRSGLNNEGSEMVTKRNRLKDWGGWGEMTLACEAIRGGNRGRTDDAAINPGIWFLAGRESLVAVFGRL